MKCTSKGILRRGLRRRCDQCDIDKKSLLLTQVGASDVADCYACTKSMLLARLLTWERFCLYVRKSWHPHTGALKTKLSEMSQSNLTWLLVGNRYHPVRFQCCSHTHYLVLIRGFCFWLPALVCKYRWAIMAVLRHMERVSLPSSRRGML